MGLAYDPVHNALLVGASTGHVTRMIRLTPTQDYLGSVVLPQGDPRTLAFDTTEGLVTMVDGRDLVAVPGRVRSGARPQAKATRLGSLGLRRPTGAAFDRRGALLILDAGKHSIVRIQGADSGRIVTRTSLAGLGPGVEGIAFNPSDGLLYVMRPTAGLLYALNGSGTIERTYSLNSLELEDPVAMTFAPSADTTDDPNSLNLFIADTGTSSSSGAVTEVKLSRVAAASEVPIVTANLVQTIDTSSFSPPSPDPAGVVYVPSTDRLMIADSEVDEVTGAGYHGVNMWQTTRTGSVTDTGTTLAYTREPTGLGFDPGTNTLFVSSDDNSRVHVVEPGPDGRFGTTDDAATFVDTAQYGVTDTEDPEFDPASGHLFFLDGISTEVYRIDPVNGVFGDGDDLMSHFDVGQYGAVDLEGLGSDESQDRLLVGDRSQRKIYEVTKSGELVRIIDARVPGMSDLSGLAMAPASDDSGRMNYWVVDRAVDNGADPAENDGKLFELSVAPDGNQAPVVDSAVIDQTAPKTNDTLSVTVSAHDPDGDPLTYSYQWNRNGIALPGQTNPTLDLSVPGTGDKGDRISVRVSASDGQALGVRTSAQVTVVNSFPTFDQDLGDRSDAEGHSVSFSAGASDADGDSLLYEATGLPSAIAVDPTTGQISGTIASGAAASSPYQVSVTVRDDAADGPTLGQTIALVQRKSGDQSATTGNSISLTFDAPPSERNLLVAFGHASANRIPTIPPGWSLALETGSGAETVVFYRIAGPNEPSTATYSVSGEPVFMGLAIFEYAGLHSIQSEVLDRVVFGSALSSTSVSTGTTEPTSQADELLLASVSLNATRAFQNSWTNGFQRQTVERRQTVAERIVSEAGHFETTESWDTSVGTALGALVAFKRAAPGQDPNPGSTTDTFTWVVTPEGGGNGAPVVTLVVITPASARTNDTLTAVVNAADPDGDPLTYSYQWIRNGIDIPGATSSTLDLSAAGNGEKGDAVSVRVTASDGSATSAPATSPEVTVVNSSPAFDQDLADRTDTEGAVVSLAAAATDPDGDPLTYGASGLPAGLSIDSSTGLISGTIAGGAASSSTYSVAVTVGEGITIDAIDTFTWTVMPRPAPAQPTGLAATVTTTDVRLAWNHNIESNLAGYNVYRGSSPSGPFTQLNGIPVPTPSYTDAAGPTGTSHYRVTAVDTGGQESVPAEKSATRRIVLQSVSTRSLRDTTTLNIIKPSGMAANDLMVAALDVLGTPTITPPPGWTLVRTDTNGSTMRQAVYYKVATSSEPKSYPWTFSSQGSAAGVILVYRGAATATPITDGDSGQANPASTSILAPGVSTTVPGAILVGFFGMVRIPSVTPPPEMFERAEIIQNGGPNKIMLEAADAILETAGPTGSRTATSTQALRNIGQLVAIRPQS